MAAYLTRLALVALLTTCWTYTPALARNVAAAGTGGRAAGTGGRAAGTGGGAAGPQVGPGTWRGYDAGRNDVVPDMGTPILQRLGSVEVNRPEEVMSLTSAPRTRPDEVQASIPEQQTTTAEMQDSKLESLSRTKRRARQRARPGRYMVLQRRRKNRNRG
ncbi:uncharacterized protein [Procambarus clarkii]|uniref:uncharacterized protein n=1 Tax=Procambarus clarkii TaxID=6728 RepID=UPI00374477FE